MTINAIDALNKLAIACDPCNETMELVRTIRAALQTPHVPVIEGLGAITNEDRTWYGVAGSIDPVAVPLKDFDKLMQCAREYLKLMKGNEK